MFDNNFGKYGPIFIFFHQLIREKISTSPAICCYTTLRNSKILIDAAIDFCHTSGTFRS